VKLQSLVFGRANNAGIHPSKGSLLREAWIGSKPTHRFFRPT